MALCNITGTVYLPSGELARSRTITFSRADKSVRAEYLGAVVPENVITQTNGAGEIDVSLLTGRYVMFTGTYSGGAVVPEALTATISDILTIVTPDIPVPAWLQQALAARDAAIAAADDAQGSADAAAASASDAEASASLAAAAANPFTSYASAASSDKTGLDKVSAIISGRLVEWIRQTGGPCLGGGWVPAGKVSPQHFNAIPNAATAATATAATSAIQGAYNWAVDNGRVLDLGGSVWVVHLSSSDQSAGTSQYRQHALMLDKDGAIVFGDDAVIKCFETEARYGVAQFVRRPFENGISKIIGGLYSGVRFDGNCADTTVWEGHQPACVGVGMSAFTFEKCRWVNAGHYGIGLQNGGHRNVRFVDCYWENTAKDGIDLKNNTNALGVSSGFDIQIIRPRMRNCCRAFDPTPSAWIDLMGFGIHVEDAVFMDIPVIGNASALIRIKQGMDIETGSRGVGGQSGVINGMSVECNAGMMVEVLYDIRAPWVAIQNVETYGTPNPATMLGLLSQPFCTVSGGKARGFSRGIYARVMVGDVASNPFGGADDTLITGVSFIDCGDAIVTDRARTKVLGNSFRNCDRGVVGNGANSINAMIVNNSFQSVPTPWSLAVQNGHIIGPNIGAAGLNHFIDTGAGGVAFLSGPAQLRLGLSADGSPGAFREALRLTGAASDVNYYRLSGAGTGGSPHLLVEGPDANIDLRLSPKGSGRVRIANGFILGSTTCPTSTFTTTDGKTITVTGGIVTGIA